MSSKAGTARRPNVLDLFGRSLGLRFQGLPGVDRFIRLLHHPDHRKSSWVETIAQGLPDGPNYHLSTRWFTEWTAWFYGSQDRAIHSWIIQNARREWVAFDIGMNYGYFACLLAKYTTAVHGFEPIPWLAARAQANADLNGFTKLAVVQTALSAQAGEALLNLPAEDDSNWGTSSLVHRTSGKAVLAVRVDTVDDYVYRNQLNRVDFIKVDVEGAEEMVLAGSTKTLDRFRPVIIFENNKESLMGIVRMLTSLNYIFCDLNDNRIDIERPSWPNDVLALPAEKYDQGEKSSA
jgi:FkbM family methyltransferase